MNPLIPIYTDFVLSPFFYCLHTLFFALFFSVPVVICGKGFSSTDFPPSFFSLEENIERGRGYRIFCAHTKKKFPKPDSSFPVLQKFEKKIFRLSRAERRRIVRYFFFEYFNCGKVRHVERINLEKAGCINHISKEKGETFSDVKASNNRLAQKKYYVTARFVISRQTSKIEETKHGCGRWGWFGPSTKFLQIMGFRRIFLSNRYGIRQFTFFLNTLDFWNDFRKIGKFCVFLLPYYIIILYYVWRILYF